VAISSPVAAAVQPAVVAGSVRQSLSAQLLLEMPFRQRCRITLSNIADEPMTL